MYNAYLAMVGLVGPEPRVDGTAGSQLKAQSDWFISIQARFREELGVGLSPFLGFNYTDFLGGISYSN